MSNVLYVKTNSRASRNIEAWLKNNDVEYIRRNMNHEPPTVEELINMLRRTNNGLDDIILEQSELIQEMGKEINNLSLKDMLTFLSEHPDAIKAPLLFTDNHFFRGYNEDELRKILPRHKKLEIRAAIYECLRNGVPYESTISL